MINKPLSVFFMAAAFYLSSFFSQANEGTLQQLVDVENPMIFQLAQGANGTGSKMTIHNNTGKKLVITGLSSDVFGMTMLHSTKFESGKRVMFHIDEIAIPADKKLALTPNTHHLMLFNPKRTLELGEFLTLHIQTNQGEFNIIAQVVPRRLK
ncbi:copper chaperone PCu(A)C [Vibrio albus]|uniref:Copper chaperone PCu(A)C n=1 Tax=Vibrio albus TaxID=2200953 RepID=A0A2U3B926_9VIBR|nr:copper chaperone PCu(A)C [Vibrio albus]PWI33277.1 copper chaperone PCu(A)C [Vibrio albus]